MSCIFSRVRRPGVAHSLRLGPCRLRHYFTSSIVDGHHRQLTQRRIPYQQLSITRNDGLRPAFGSTDSSLRHLGLLSDNHSTRHTPKRHLSIEQPPADSATAATKSLEDTYSRKTPLEHILLRPSMYVGPTERLPPVSSWVLQSDIDSSVSTPSPWTMQRQELSCVPALIKIFDEILVNASDNRLRHPGSCNQIDVIIHRGGKKGVDKRLLEHIPDPSKPYISIRNNGKSIPIQIHKKENIYIPELLFGHLLTGSNFDDEEKRLTGGRHGYGAKLTNVFSEQFTLEIGDAHSTKGKYKTYKQTWEHNMSVCHEAEVTTVDRDGTLNIDDLEFTKVSFVPDLSRLTHDHRRTTIPDEEYQLMRRRVVDIAGCAGGKLAVTLNGEPIALSGFQDYVDLYRHHTSSSTQPPPTFYHKLNSRWEVVVGLSEHKSLESISFVNGMSTSRGGTHVDVISRQISQYIADYINTKMSKELDRLQAQAPINITPRMVRRHLFLCVNSLIENPSFDSQMKECLTSNPENFGSQFELPNRFLKKLVKPLDASKGIDEDIDESDVDEHSKPTKGEGPGIVEQVIQMAMGVHQFNIAKLMKEIGASGKQNKRQVLSIPKLEDANLAGSTSVGVNNPCTLILTEGDSAKALAVAGLEVVGRDHYGVFPLRGKFMNVRSVTVTKLTSNAELKVRYSCRV
jgi:DNA topoisomerase-2